MRTVTSNESFFGDGGDFFVCVLVLLQFLPQYIGYLPDKDGCVRNSE